MFLFSKSQCDFYTIFHNSHVTSFIYMTDFIFTCDTYMVHLLSHKSFTKCISLHTWLHAVLFPRWFLPDLSSHEIFKRSLDFAIMILHFINNFFNFSSHVVFIQFVVFFLQFTWNFFTRFHYFLHGIFTLSFRCICALTGFVCFHMRLCTIYLFIYSFQSDFLTL